MLLTVVVNRHNFAAICHHMATDGNATQHAASSIEQYVASVNVGQHSMCECCHINQLAPLQCRRTLL